MADRCCRGEMRLLVFNLTYHSVFAIGSLKLFPEREIDRLTDRQRSVCRPLISRYECGEWRGHMTTVSHTHTHTHLTVLPTVKPHVSSNLLLSSRYLWKNISVI